MITTIVLGSLIAGCIPSGTSVSEPTAANLESDGYQTLSIDQFANIIANQSAQYTIVNVHIPYEGEIAETDLTIPYNDISNHSI